MVNVEAETWDAWIVLKVYNGATIENLATEEIYPMNDDEPDDSWIIVI